MSYAIKAEDCQKWRQWVCKHCTMGDPDTISEIVDLEQTDHKYEAVRRHVTGYCNHEYDPDMWGGDPEKVNHPPVSGLTNEPEHTDSCVAVESD